MVEQGMAWAFLKFSDEYEAAQSRAKRAKRGIWRGPAEPAWEFRETRWTKAAQTAPEGCPIKGNISPNGKIYHTPWSPWYSRTRINTTKGERWFCDEAEAIKGRLARALLEVKTNQFPTANSNKLRRVRGHHAPYADKDVRVQPTF